MNLDLAGVGGEILVVSQFTLLADASRGRRPSFEGAAPGDLAEPLVDLLAERLRAAGVRVGTGRFGAHMRVELLNDGPVTLVLDF
jgi:D-tyrosyl-tRNA(Tyr) deacylase